MSAYNIDAPRIGTIASLKPYRRVDGRTCFRCGARAGQCEHLQADEDIIWMSASKEKPINPAKAWSQEERATILDLTKRHSFSRIADMMNTTEGAIAGVVFRGRRDGL